MPSVKQLLQMQSEFTKRKAFIESAGTYIVIEELIFFPFFLLCDDETAQMNRKKNTQFSVESSRNATQKKSARIYGRRE